MLNEAAATLDREVCYRALRTRDARFDGRFYTGVSSTGIFCRPICPARTPKLENCLFLPSAAAAQRMGFRPCLRCRPEAAPGTAVTRGSANTVSRALQLIAEGGHGADVEALADRLGIGSRQLRRLFDRHVGASPVAVAQTQRLLFATKLLTETELPMTEVALASGFGSVRRFNAAFSAVYARPPSSLRRQRAARSDQTTNGPSVQLKLPFSPPYDFAALLEFLAARAIPGVEVVSEGCYRRSFALAGAVGSVEVRAAEARHARRAPAAERGGRRATEPASYLLARIRTSDVGALGAIVARLRRLFDLDADSRAIDAQLAHDPDLAERVRTRPGLRVPGAWDGFELAVRAVLGQQISVRAATTIAGRLVSALGTPLPAAQRENGFPERLFPTPRALARAELADIGLTSARRATLRALAQAVDTDPSFLQVDATLEQTLHALQHLPGVGPWTAQYIAMRALREPDAFPSADLGLLRALETAAGRPSAKELEARAEAWRPFRAYAAVRLWAQPLPAAG